MCVWYTIYFEGVRLCVHERHFSIWVDAKTSPPRAPPPPPPPPPNFTTIFDFFLFLLGGYERPRHMYKGGLGGLGGVLGSFL